MKQKFFLVLLCSVIISLSFLKDVSNYLQTPSDHMFLFPHNFPYDHQMLLSEINQAANGRFLFLDKFTSEPQPGHLIHPLYIPVGILAGLFNIPSYLAYQIARFVVAVGLLLTIYWFMDEIFPQNNLKRNLAFFLASLIPGYVKVVQTDQGVNFARYLDLWTGSDLLHRNALLPHGMLKIICLLVVFALSVKWFKSPQKSSLLAIIFVSTLLILLEPVNALFIILLWLFLFLKELISFLKTTNLRLPLKKILVFSFALFPSMIAFIYMFIVSFSPEWAVLKAWEKNIFYSIDYKEYILSFGPLIFLAVPGFLLFLKRNTPFRILIILLTIASLFLLFYPLPTKILGITNFRFLGMPLFVFFAAASSEAIVSFINLFKKRRSLILFILLFFTVIHIPFYSLLVIKDLTGPPFFYDPYNPYFYPSKSTYEALIYLKNNTNHEQIVFSNGFLGNIIPGISGNTVAIGHQISTINYWDKFRLYNEFIAGKMTAGEAKNLVTNLRADYLAIEDTEKTISNLSNYPFLTPVFSNTAMTIYKVVF